MSFLPRLTALALVCLVASPAVASIPDFNVFNAPETVRKAATPAARQFWSDLVEHSKKESRKMFEDTKKETGLKNSDMRKKDWDCLFWRAAATFARSIQRKHPGLQPPEFAAELERIALDKDDCGDDGKGPGGRGVLVYEAAAHRATARDSGWQKGASATAAHSAVPAWTKSAQSLIQAFAALGVVIGDAAEGAAAVAGGLVPVLVLPEELIEELMSGQKPVKSL